MIKVEIINNLDKGEHARKVAERLNEIDSDGFSRGKPEIVGYSVVYISGNVTTLSSMMYSTVIQWSDSRNPSDNDDEG